MKKNILGSIIFCFFSLNSASVKYKTSARPSAPSQPNIPHTSPPTTSSKIINPVQAPKTSALSPSASTQALSSLTEDMQLDPKFIEKMILDTKISMKEILKEFEAAEEEALKYYINTLKELINSFTQLNSKGPLAGKLTQDINELTKFTNERIQFLNSTTSHSNALSNQIQTIKIQAQKIQGEVNKISNDKNFKFNEQYKQEVEKGKKETEKVNAQIKVAIDDTKKIEAEVNNILKDIQKDLESATISAKSAQQVEKKVTSQLESEKNKTSPSPAKVKNKLVTK